MYNRPWTEEEMEIMRTLYPHVGSSITIDELVTLLDRSRSGIRGKAKNMGLQIEIVTPNIDREMLEQLQNRIKI